MSKLPKPLKDFLRAIEPPPGDTPIADLHMRYAERQLEERRKLMHSSTFNFPHDSVEFAVEVRIRQWMREQEAEQRERERRLKAEKDKAGKPDAPPQITGPKPKSPPPKP